MCVIKNATLQYLHCSQSKVEVVWVLWGMPGLLQQLEKELACIEDNEGYEEEADESHDDNSE